jgi:hypothetical protein
MPFDYNENSIVGFYEDAIANVNKRYDNYRGGAVNAANNVSTLNTAINDFNRDGFIILGSESDSDDLRKQALYTGREMNAMPVKWPVNVPRLKLENLRIMLDGWRSNELNPFLTNTIFFTADENGNLVKAGLVAQKGGRKSRRGKRNSKKRNSKKRRGSSKKRN